MVILRMVGTEVTALGAAALSMPLRLLLRHDRFDPGAPHQTPVVLAHGFCGDPTNFLVLRNYLAARGVGNIASFAYPPRFDYQRLAPRLARMIESVCRATGAPHVDVVGHSLGGLIARYLIDMSEGGLVRRLVTLGAPYFGCRIPPQELAIFAAYDPFIPKPHPVYGPHGRVRMVEDCGHWGLLYHPAVLREVAAFVSLPSGVIGLPAAPLALEAAS